MRQLLALCLGIAFTCQIASAAPPNAEVTPPESHESDKVFGLTKLWTVHLRVSADEWKQMQPQGGGPNFGPPPAGGPPMPGAAPFRPGSFGYEFEYVKGDVQIGDETYRDVGVRLKGNGTYLMSAQGHKRPFKIDFGRYTPDQRFHGLKQLNLQNNVMDPTNVRQPLAFEVFQVAGIPAPRTAIAEVYLTIDGQSERELLGVYTLVEEIDSLFIRRHYRNDQGLLLKPEGTQGIEYRGEDWANYQWYEPKSKPTAAQQKRLIDLARLVHKADDEQFRREIGSYLDVDEFTRYLAANTLLSNMDSFLTHVHNYYMYLRPETNQFVFLPWDVDLAMGAFLMVGNAQQLQDLSIALPHVGESKLIERLLAMEEVNQTYRKHLANLLETCFSPDGMTTRNLPTIRATIREAVAREEKHLAEAPKPPGPPGPFAPGRGGPFGNVPSAEDFIAKRIVSIKKQLAGESKGYVPQMAFGPGGGGPPPGPGVFLAQPLTAAVDKDKNKRLSLEELLASARTLFEKCDRDAKGALNDNTFAEGFARILPLPPGFPAGPAEPPPGGGPARFLAIPIFEKADLDKDKSLSLDELLKGTTTLFEQVDADKSKDLDERELAKGFEVVFPPPPTIKQP